jgi:hypothetical protein
MVALATMTAQRNSTLGPNLSLQRFSVPMQISATQADILGALTVVGSTAGSYTLSIAMYSFNHSTISTLSATSMGYTFNSGGAATLAAESSLYVGQSGTRWRSIGLGTWNLTPGEYMLGLMVSINGPAGTTGTMTLFGGSSVNLNTLQPGLVTNSTASGYTGYWMDHMVNSASSAFPATIQLSQMQGSALPGQEVSQLAQPYIRFMGTF